MTCKDCLHYDVCVIVQYSSKEYDHYTEFGCEDFKDKANHVEVVRCKDCENYLPLGDEYVYNGKKAMLCWLEWKPTPENYYCACGVRKSVTDINVGDKKE